jgi:two-component system nitrogen regulation response regulator GlnG
VSANGPGPVGPAARQLGELVPQVADALLTTGGGGVHREVLALVERRLLAHALERTRGNQLRAARLLGINRNTLHKRCRQLGLLAASRIAGVAAVSRD